MNELVGQSVLVTGGGSGIGAAICRRLAAGGASVLVSDVDEDRAATVRQEIDESGSASGRVAAIRLDVADAKSVKSAVEAADDLVGPLDGLVNCAGADVIKPFIETDEDLWQWLVELNFLGFLRTTKAVLPGMLDRNSGRVINIASDAGRTGSSGEAVYSACKGGMIAFTKSLAREVARSQVTVNAVCPGPTNTPATQKTLESGGDRLIKAMTKAVPLGRLGEPDDIAGAVAFLASKEAGFITGQTLSVSGGLSMA